jgi:small-conductance mechanosensitive channel
MTLGCGFVTNLWAGSPLRRACVLVALFLPLLCVVAAPSVHAQTFGLEDSEGVGEATALPDPLTQEAIRDLLAQLDDQQVREILLQRLSEEADRRARELAAQDQRDLDDIAEDYAVSLGEFFFDVIRLAPSIPATMSLAFANFQEARGDRSTGAFLFSLALCLAVGLAAAAVVHRSTRGWRNAGDPGAAIDIWSRLRIVASRFFSRMLSIVTFGFVALVCNLILNERHGADLTTVAELVTAIAWTWAVMAMMAFVLSPSHPDQRLCSAPDDTARSLVRSGTVVAAVFNFGFGFDVWMHHMGIPFGAAWYGFWVNLLFHLLIAGTIWSNRAGIRMILMGHIDQSHRIDRWFATWWPQVSIGLLFAHWLLSVLAAATGTVDQNTLTAMALTLSILIGLPLIDQSVRAMARGLIPVRPDKDPAIEAADEETRIGLVRVCRVVVVTLGAVLLLKLWGVDIVALAEQVVGARFARSVIDMFLIVALTYGLWELIRIVTNRQIAMERIALGLEDDAEQESDGEGGGAGARLGTILPLARLVAQVTLLIMAALAVLGELGVNILPLVAGAGVVGLAIGFGAQTLVKDIVSGVFFLIDDAFRKGEYVDIGSVKGTVEKISVRSMQLRHHRGPLHTVPFGDIGHVTNFSRDWAIMKLPLRLTYDTDAEKVRKMIKKLGQELLEDPELGPQFLQPLKSQGVVQMEDSAQIMSIKFMTRPGDQWMLRRVIFSKIRDLFEKNGIRFANREVTVRLNEENADRPLTDTERRQVAGSAARAVIEADELPAQGS